jgi:RES domain-containing protein
VSRPEQPEEGDGHGSSAVDGGFVGIAFRQCHPDHAGVADTVRASAAFPSRFTPLGGRFGVLYVALAPETATAELRRRAAQLGVPVSALAPRAMLTLAIRLRRVLDLSDPAVRAAWGITLEDLASDDYARCQEVAVAAREDGYEAIRHPSAAVASADIVDAAAGELPRSAAAVNLAIFADRLHPGSDVRVVRSDVLPLDGD